MGDRNYSLFCAECRRVIQPTEMPSSRESKAICAECHSQGIHRTKGNKPNSWNALRLSKRQVVLLVVYLTAFCGVPLVFLPSLVGPDLDAARCDTARNQLAIFEMGCKDYMKKHDGQPPPSLDYLVAPDDGSKPLVEGGQSVLVCPVQGGVFEYDPTHLDAEGKLDPMVIVKLHNGKILVNSRR